MISCRTIRRVGVVGCGLGAVVLLTGAAGARPEYLAAWSTIYPTSTIADRMFFTTGSDCNVCHHPTQRRTQGTCYREDMIDLLSGGMGIIDAINTLDDMDSDGDGVPNGVEILAQRVDDPSQIGYHPGLIGDLGTDPCGTDPGEVVTGVSETPDASCAADFNGDGVVNTLDFLSFLNAFSAGDASADFNGDGTVNTLDFLAFLNAFNAGC